MPWLHCDITIQTTGATDLDSLRNFHVPCRSQIPAAHNVNAAGWRRMLSLESLTAAIQNSVAGTTIFDVLNVRKSPYRLRHWEK